MSEIPLSSAGDLPSVVSMVNGQREPVWLTEGGQPVAAVIDPISMQHLLRIYRQARSYSAEPFGDADKADMGL